MLTPSFFFETHSNLLHNRLITISHIVYWLIQFALLRRILNFKKFFSFLSYTSVSPFFTRDFCYNDTFAWRRAIEHFSQDTNHLHSIILKYTAFYSIYKGTYNWRKSYWKENAASYFYPKSGGNDRIGSWLRPLILGSNSEISFCIQLLHTVDREHRIEMISVRTVQLLLR